jgi:hypothetical protein
MNTRLLLAATLFLACITAHVQADEPPLAEQFLIEGKLADGIEALKARLTTHGNDDQARFGLGVLQFVKGVERLGQSVHHYGGMGSQSPLAQILPFVRLPVPENPDPAEVSYADVRGMIAAFLADLATAEKTLAAIKDDNVSLPLRFGLVRLDLDGDGKASESEALWRLMAALGRRPGNVPDDPAIREAAEAFVVRLDRGDAYWLQGYCRLLSALGEYALAYDMKASFNVLAPHVFAKPKVRELPEKMFAGKSIDFFGDVNPIVDAIAAIHEWHFEVVEPARTATALKHLEEVLRLSRLSWKAIEAETDDDHEWIPSTTQSSVIPGMQVTAKMLAGWQEFLDEADAILAGRHLVPHWRLAEGYGINLRRVFLEPRKMDLVRWVQGAAAVPYVDEGECTDPATWQRIQRAFRGQFIGFAIWFN